MCTFVYTWIMPYVTEPVCNDIYTVYVAAGQAELYYTAFEQ